MATFTPIAATPLGGSPTAGSPLKPRKKKGRYDADTDEMLYDLPEEPFDANAGILQSSKQQAIDGKKKRKAAPASRGGGHEVFTVLN